jgi:hypothetical protein
LLLWLVNFECNKWNEKVGKAPKTFPDFFLQQTLRTWSWYAFFGGYKVNTYYYIQDWMIS